MLDDSDILRRGWDEYRRFNIPGGMSCPNGELVLHIDGIVKDPKTRIVVNCAGRTRSIIGAQTLIDWGVPNEVVRISPRVRYYPPAPPRADPGSDFPAAVRLPAGVPPTALRIRWARMMVLPS